MTARAGTAADTAIVGIGATEFSKNSGRSELRLAAEAVRAALDDAALTPADVDGLVTFTMDGNAEIAVARELGIPGLSFFGQVGYGGGAACATVQHAAMAVATGAASVVVCYRALNERSGRRFGRVAAGATATPTTSGVDNGWHYPMGIATPAATVAMVARRYMHEFGVTSEDLAEVAVTHRYHATLNPASVMGRRGPVTVADVIGSRMVCDPLHLLDCAIDNDGGYAIVIAAEDVARDCRKPPVWVLGGAEATYTDAYTTIDVPWFPEDGKAVRRTADMAFQIAGVSRDDIDVGGLYDCFTVTMLRDLEEMGFCKLGEGADYVKEGHLRLGGSMPTNTDGGLLSNSHCGDPSGMHTIEVVRQLRGECGARQVPNARIGVSLQQGWAVHGMASTLIMAAD